MSSSLVTSLILSSQIMKSRKKNNPIQLMCNDLSRISNNDLMKSLLSPLKCENLKSCLNNMNKVKLRDLGFDKEDLDELTCNLCANIICTDTFNIAIFLIPKGHSIPLHDHPNMGVLSKVICGEVELNSFTLCNSGIKRKKHPDDTIEIGVRESKSCLSGSEDEVGVFCAEKTHSCRKSPDDPAWFITPIDDNIHEFTAVSNCVVLDCLLPPYDDLSRPCTYFVAKPIESEIDRNPSNCHYKLRVIPEPTFGLPSTMTYYGYVPTLEVANSV